MNKINNEVTSRCAMPDFLRQRTSLSITTCLTALLISGCTPLSPNGEDTYPTEITIEPSPGKIFSRIAVVRSKAEDRMNIIAATLNKEHSQASTELFVQRYCPEFTPTTTSNEFQLLQPRSAGVRFYEQGLYGLCIAALNKWLEVPNADTRACKKKARERLLGQMEESAGESDGRPNLYDVFYRAFPKKGTEDFSKENIEAIGQFSEAANQLFETQMPLACYSEYERAFWDLRERTVEILKLEATGSAMPDAALFEKLLAEEFKEEFEEFKEEFKKEFKEEFEKFKEVKDTDCSPKGKAKTDCSVSGQADEKLKEEKVKDTDCSSEAKAKTDCSVSGQADEKLKEEKVKDTDCSSEAKAKTDCSVSGQADEKLRAEFKKIKTDCSALKQADEKLRAEFKKIKTDCSALKQADEELKEKFEKLKAEFEKVKKVKTDCPSEDVVPC